MNIITADKASVTVELDAREAKRFRSSKSYRVEIEAAVLVAAKKANVSATAIVDVLGPRAPIGSKTLADFGDE